jgi:hypothetical protein
LWTATQGIDYLPVKNRSIGLKFAQRWQLWNQVSEIRVESLDYFRMRIREHQRGQVRLRDQLLETSSTRKPATVQLQRSYIRRFAENSAECGLFNWHR